MTSFTAITLNLDPLFRLNSSLTALVFLSFWMYSFKKAGQIKYEEICPLLFGEFATLLVGTTFTASLALWK